MDTRTADRFTTKYPLGGLIDEGKTKKVYEIRNNKGMAVIASKDDITAGDGAKHDVILGKGKFANQTTCNVFRLLKTCGIQVAFEEQDSATSFVAPRCKMIPNEVVVRREAHGSYLKRNPHLSKGQIFPRLRAEHFLKTKDRRWKKHKLVCDDPYMVYVSEGTTTNFHLFNPAKPIHGQEPFLVIPWTEVLSFDGEQNFFPEMRRLARETFLILEKAWQILGYRLVDFKVEFGFDDDGKLLLADVIDNDSWRVLENGAYIDKQVYRDGGSLDLVADNYKEVAELTGRFRLPNQRIILWRGSEKDNIDPFVNALEKENLGHLPKVVTCSVHREPVTAIDTLNRMLQEVPDSVIIAYVGMSNGAGPVLSAASTVPVIAVPANAKEFPEDVWSSLRTPSAVPVMTVLEPVNAVLAALNILSASNPLIYAKVRGEIEARLVNTIPV